MKVDLDHVLNIDGADKAIGSDAGAAPAHLRSPGGGVKLAGSGMGDDKVSVMSGFSGKSKTPSQMDVLSKMPWYRGVTCKDVRDIMPTVLILIGGLLIMIFVIPYAFSTVIKQLEAEQMLERAREESRMAEASGASSPPTPLSSNSSSVPDDDNPDNHLQESSSPDNLEGPEEKGGSSSSPSSISPIAQALTIRPSSSPKLQSPSSFT